MAQFWEKIRMAITKAFISLIVELLKPSTGGLTYFLIPVRF